MGLAEGCVLIIVRLDVLEARESRVRVRAQVRVRARVRVRVRVKVGVRVSVRK